MRPVLHDGANDRAVASVKLHLNDCRECWAIWNALRWEIAATSTHLQELREYMGVSFRYGLDSSWLLAEEWNSRPRTSRVDVEKFYRETPWYVYNQVIFVASGQRPPYGPVAMTRMAESGVRSILDFGCGVGTDGLLFASAGYFVKFIDINRHCRSFLEWRIARRQLSNAKVIASVDSSHGCDTLWLMDVVEHLPVPEDVLRPLLPGVNCVFVDTHTASDSGGRHPFHYEESFGRAAVMLRDEGFVHSYEDRLDVWERKC